MAKNPSDICSHPLEEKTVNKVVCTKSVFNEDLISGLPDEILADILSFVPTKTAITTSVLSKRWIRIWISVPNLDLGLYCRSADRYLEKKPIFVDFVDRVLSLNNVLSVRKVYLSCPYIECELSRVTAWTSSLFRRDAEEFHVELPDCLDDLHRVIYFEPGCQFYSVPDCFFNQNNLVKLILKNVVMKVPSSVWFPKLKIINFYEMQLHDDDSVKNLLSGCPVLRSLTMHRWNFDDAQALYFCPNTLNYLNLKLGYCGKDFGYHIVINAPNLTHLDLTDKVGMNYNAINIPSLVEVNLDFEECEGRLCGIIGCIGERLFHLLRQISHVKELVLTSGTMRSFPIVSLEDMPMFHKLTKLNVGVSCNDNWSILPHLFHCTPNLVTLILDLAGVHPDCAWYEYEPLDVPQCYSSSIQFVEISSFKECEEEMGMIIYILKNAMVLKKLSIISFKLDLVQETNIIKRLLILPKSSSACVIEYENFMGLF